MVRVIFLENLEDYKVGEVKEVPDGYARNFLFKRGLAKLATEAEVKNVEEKLAKLQKEEQKKVAEAQAVADKLSKKPIVIQEEVNDEGNLYGTVSNREVADKLVELGYEIDPANIEIEEPIKGIGKHEVLVKVGHGVETMIEVQVERRA